MKTITLVAWKRPDLLKQVLDGLAENNTRGYSLVAVLDAGHDPECYSLLHGVGFMPKHLDVLTEHHGVHHAGKRALQSALAFGSTFNLALEEDTVPSPDCVQLVNWWEKQDDASPVLNCFSFSRSQQEDAFLVKRDGFFNAWGWAAHRHQIEFFLRHWQQLHAGWDDSISRHLKLMEVFTDYPALSRITNIGPVGAHYTPELFNKHFAGCVAAHEKIPSAYVFA